MLKSILKLSFLALAILTSTYFIYRYTWNRSVSLDKNIEHVDTNGITKLMIVAHPDDDFIWGGSHLIDDDYLVVCVTCGVRRDRVLEFKKAMNKTGEKYIMLGYPDKTKGKRDDWSSVYESISKDLEKIITYKDWDSIVTHNPDGEYGHIHHKMTSKIVTTLSNKDKLMYFGKYYTKENIPEDLPKISRKNSKIKKKELIPIYASQGYSMDKFGHMFDYENWRTYAEWNQE